MPLVDELEDELELLELLDDELELLEELDELEEPLLLQSAACGLPPLPSISCMLSIFARPPLVVACKRMRWLPALGKLTVVDAVFQVDQPPVAGKLTLEPTVLPLIIT